MSDSYSMYPLAARGRPPARRKVLITGAAGNIGSYLASEVTERYELSLMARPGENTDSIEQFGSVVRARLEDLNSLKEAFAGADTIVHLAANALPDAVWSDLLRDNIVGTYNAMVAAHYCRCRRVIFASSIHAVNGYSMDRQIQADDPVNPGDLYGVSKCFGEAMARYMTTQHNLSAIVIRIGAFQPVEAASEPANISMMNLFVSHRDLAQLIRRCIDDETLRFAIFHGLSGNLFNRMNIEETRELVGYEPQDDMTAQNPLLKDVIAGKINQQDESSLALPSGLRNEL